MTRSILHAAALALVLLPSFAAAADDDPVLIRNSTAVVRKSDLDLEMTRIPPDLREEFLTNRKRVGDLLIQTLTRKSLAAQATTDKLDQRPENAARLAAERERVLAQLRLQAVEEQAAREFDAKLEQNRVRARELYLVDREKYRSAEEVSASHILFDTRKRSPEEARKLAEATRARIVAGADFNAVAKEVSEDPSAQGNGGSLGYFQREQMDPAFSKAAFALKQVGAVSEPVQSGFGVHLIRLDGRKPSAVRPFEEVRDEIVAEMRTRYVADKRDQVIADIRGDPALALDEASLETIVSRARRSSPGAPPASGTRAPAATAAPVKP